MARTVWAFAPLEELGGETGYVSVEDEALAEELIAGGHAQDPFVIGFDKMKALEAGPARSYRTRQMTAEKPAPPPPPAKQPPPPEPNGGKKRGRAPKGS